MTLTLTTTTADDTTAEFWAEQINAETTRTIESIFRTGQLFIDAKSKCKHGEFLRLFDEKLVPFRARAAQSLMDVTRQFANTQSAAHLPPHWSILADLVQIKSAALQAGIAAGIVTPTMSRRAATAFRRQQPPRTTTDDVPAKPARTTKADRVARLDRMRELAADGHTAEQIAHAVGLHEHSCKATMKTAGIVCTADNVLGRTRHRLNANRIVASIVDTFGDLESDQSLIDFATLDLAKVPGWVDSLVASQRVLGTFIARLRRHTRKGIMYAADSKIQSVDPSHVEGSTRSD